MHRRLFCALVFERSAYGFAILLRPSLTCSNALYKEAGSMLRASAATLSPSSNMLRYIYTISRFLLGVFWDVPKYSKKWLTFGAFRVHQKALGLDAGGLTIRAPCFANHTVIQW